MLYLCLHLSAYLCLSINAWINVYMCQSVSIHADVVSESVPTSVQEILASISVSACVMGTTVCVCQCQGLCEYLFMSVCLGKCL